MSSLISVIRQVMRPIERRVLLSIGRAVVKRIDDSKKVQSLQLQLLAGEVGDDAEHVHPYGLTSVPVEDAEALVLCVGGSRDHPMAIVFDRRHRPLDLAAGEVALHKDDNVPRVHLKANDEVHLGETPTNFVALANLVLSELDDIKTDQTTLKGLLTTHVHPGVTAGGAATAVSPGFASYTPHTPASVAAAEVKAK